MYFLVEENHDVGQLCMNCHCDHFYQFSIDKQAAVSKELKKSNNHKEEEGNGDSDYSDSQLESSDSSIVLEMEDDSMSLSQASSDEQLEAYENGPIFLSRDLEGKLYLTECVRAIMKEPQVHVCTCTIEL